MAALTINGWEIPLAETRSPSLSYQRVGPADALAADGSILRTSTAHKWTSPRLQTTPLSLAEGRSLQRLLLGMGEVWTFNESGSQALVGSKGTGPEAGSAGARSVAQAKHGAASLLCASGDDHTYDAGSSTWSLLFWRYSTQWDHYALTSAGEWWDGTSKGSGTNPSNFTTTSGSLLTLRGRNDAGSDSDSYYDHVVIVPYVLADAAIEAFAADSDPFGVLKLLSCGGDLVEGSSGLQCVGAGVQGETMWRDGEIKMSVSFALREA